jgi:hypothetical protein
MPHKRKKLEFKEQDLWYLVGLIATDGNLSSDGRHINVTSKHLDFLATLKGALRLENVIGTKSSGSRKDRKYYQIQFSNRNFYDFLLSVGLTPKKSLTLGPLKVPNAWFADFLRGVIDGDGSIRRWIHPSNGAEQWSLRVYSGSSTFMRWLESSIERRFLVSGQIHTHGKGLHVLKYGKLAAKRVFQNCYYEGCLGLERKINLAKVCGTSNAGWSKSKTVYCEV